MATKVSTHAKVHSTTKTLVTGLVAAFVLSTASAGVATIAEKRQENLYANARYPFQTQGYVPGYVPGYIPQYAPGYGVPGYVPGYGVFKKLNGVEFKKELRRWLNSRLFF